MAPFRQTTPPTTVISVHGLQLSPSFDSVITPPPTDEVLSAQARIEYVPAFEKVSEGEVEIAVLFPASAVIVEEARSVIVPPPPAAVALWKKLLNPVPVPAVLVLEITEEKVNGTPEVATAGVGASAVRFGRIGVVNNKSLP